MLGRKIGSPYDGEIDGLGGWWSIDEPEPHLCEAVMVPDLAGWRRERLAVRNPWVNRFGTTTTGPPDGVQTRFRQATPTGRVTELTLMRQAK